MEKVVVGMSGGVDSAVTAYLLKEAGYDVIGVTLRTWESDGDDESRCCDIDDARRVADALGIRYVPVNCASAFREHVVDPFTNAYLRGRTPNPCIECNRFVKWDKLLYYAKAVGAEHIATGHYANVVRLSNGRYTVQTAAHAGKDQTYVLYRLTQEQLAATLMPLGGFTKDEVRSIAREANLPVANKPDSQEVCFVTDGSYADYIESTSGASLPEGDFVDAQGNVLGRHRGIIRYTVGQRKGLGLSLGAPAYVNEIRVDRNEVVVGDEASLYRGGIVCRDVCFMGVPGIEPGGTLSCTVKIRYQHAGQAAVVEPTNEDAVRVTFEKPVRAPAPGQSAVFYDETGRVLGGGVIDETL